LMKHIELFYSERQADTGVTEVALGVRLLRSCLCMWRVEVAVVAFCSRKKNTGNIILRSALVCSGRTGSKNLILKIS